MTHASALALGMLGGPEWFVILLVAVLFFGKRIPGVARSLGSGITEFKHGLREGADSNKADKPDKLEAAPDDSDEKAS